ncbi:anthrone oxygenase family protein [Pseudoponticoccus marisrubri]|uniref:DUF1772 domain-containing protein n=1 Tax=Pseudoponticoccus marisrubri TaxID=1685382 RepID=A0A0W7WIF4_9RHOB|nr:anthrone oxygenase family protein [Pseudoponticoccus marisrubri]KUF10319.1 hypothetical protein AVJ23_13005 [Pseudoponticoccus marisrubri]
MSPLVLTVSQLAVLAYALVGGVFLAFSDFLMRALARSGGGPEAMQVINREVFRWVFMTLFLGLALVSALLIAQGALVLGGRTGTLMAAAGLVYLLGCFGVTVVCNVPMNETLARMETTDPDTHAYWSATYLPRWTFWNTVRTLACIAAAGLLLLAVTAIARAG